MVYYPRASIRGIVTSCSEHAQMGQLLRGGGEDCVDGCPEGAVSHLWEPCRERVGSKYPVSLSFLLYPYLHLYLKYTLFLQGLQS